MVWRCLNVVSKQLKVVRIRILGGWKSSEGGLEWPELNVVIGVLEVVGSGVEVVGCGLSVFEGGLEMVL